MSTQLQSNRVDLEIAKWQSVEDRYKKLFASSSSIKVSLLKEKLKFYDGILAKYKYTQSFDERVALQVVKSERLSIIKELYPYDITQFFHRMVNSFIIDKLKSIEFAKGVENNNQLLREKLQQTGFKDAFNKVKKYMGQGLDKFSVPVSYYVNEKESLNHILNFGKSEFGHYQLEGFRTVLRNEIQSAENREHDFKIDEFNVVNATQAYNLLSGRAVLREGTWIQFDLNDKNADDNYRIKEFHSGYDFNIDNALNELPLKETIDKIELQKLGDSLKEGGREEITLCKDGKGGKFYIEANPQFKTLTVFNEKLVKVTLVDPFKKVVNKVMDLKQNFEQGKPKISKSQSKSIIL